MKTGFCIALLLMAGFPAVGADDPGGAGGGGFIGPVECLPCAGWVQQIADARQRLEEVKEEIQRQESASASTTDADGVTTESRYDMETGQRVTTETRPDGTSEVTNREDSSYMQGLMAERDQLPQTIADLEQRLADCIEENCPPDPPGPVTFPPVTTGPEGSLDFLVQNFWNVIPVLDEYEASHNIRVTDIFIVPGDGVNAGGTLVTVVKPDDERQAANLVAALSADPRVTDVEDNSCRGAFPETNLLERLLSTVVPPAYAVQADSVSGTLVAPGNQPYSGGTLTLGPPDPPPAGEDPGWSGADGRGPITAFSGPDGAFTFDFGPGESVDLDNGLFEFGGHWNSRVANLGDLSNSVGESGPPAASTGSCTAADPNLCLSDGRFDVQVDWKCADSGCTEAPAIAAPQTDTSGGFYFFDPENWEMMIKVLDGCDINNNFWVFFAATTNVEYTVSVTDTATGWNKEFTNPLGNPAPAVVDTSAFATCP